VDHDVGRKAADLLPDSVGVGDVVFWQVDTQDLVLSQHLL
jgi:hypothetical protein